MNSELSNILSNVYYFNLGATATIGLLLLKKYRNTYTKYFIYFLVYVFLLEVIAIYPSHLYKFETFKWIKGTRYNNNYWYYTIFWQIGSACFFSFYFQMVLKIQLFKNILKYGRYLFILLSIIIIVSDFNKLFTVGFSTIDYCNTILIIGSVVLFFIEVLSTNIILSFNKNINFFIASSILIWWLVTIPLSIYSEYYNIGDMDYVYLSRILMACSNIFMYTCFAIGLIVSKPQLKND